MVLGYLSHIVAMFTPRRRSLTVARRWRFRLPILAPRKGKSTGAIFMYGAAAPRRCGMPLEVHAKTTSYAGLRR